MLLGCENLCFMKGLRKCFLLWPISWILKLTFINTGLFVAQYNIILFFTESCMLYLIRKHYSVYIFWMWVHIYAILT